MVGCGLGGLATAYAISQAGHRVTVLESAKQLSEVGAGIQVSPNFSRLLIRWGLGPALQTVSCVPGGVNFRRWSSGERLGRTDARTMEPGFGAPYYHIHRADLHKLLYDLAAPHIDLHLNSTVVELVQGSPPVVKTSDGKSWEADLIIGADGVKSMLRSVILGAPDAPIATGDAAYRALIPASKLLEDPDLAPLVQKPEVNIWLGPAGHIVSYCVRAQELYNVVLLHPDDGSVESWTSLGSAEKMRADFEGWDPRIGKLLALVPSTHKWKLCAREPFKKWIHDEGRVVLLGDACHPMLPYAAQGAAMAVEDAAVLGNLLSHLTTIEQLAPLLQAYEDLRYSRTAEIQSLARLNQMIFQLPDGEGQQLRDGALKRSLQGAEEDSLPIVIAVETNENSKQTGFHRIWNSDSETKSKLVTAVENEEKHWSNATPNAAETGLNLRKWADLSKLRDQYIYDADAAVDQWWQEEGKTKVEAIVA